MDNRLRFGHAPNHLTQAFEIYVDTDEVPKDVFPLLPVWRHDEALFDALRDCTDIMPASLCNSLDLPAGSDYAAGVLTCEAHIERQSAELGMLEQSPDWSAAD